MTRKNPENKPLRVVRVTSSRSDIMGRHKGHFPITSDEELGPIMIEMMHAQSRLVRAGKDSAMPHFIACVKEIERIYGFKFEQIPDDEE